jgi:shikimate kinase
MREQRVPDRRMASIVLIGFMGSGKTVVGQEIARRLGRPFVDTDTLVEEAAGMRVTEIFARFGEAHFRALERDTIAKVCASCAARDAVVATGGGAMLDPENRRRLGEIGPIVCLDADVDSILQRVGGDTARPLLRGADVRARVRALLEERERVYAMADHRVDTSGRSVAAVADAVLAAVASAVGVCG